MKTKRFVRQSLFFLCLLAPCLMMGRTSTHAEILPDIEAQQSKIVPLQKSKTGRVYRFKMDPKELPKTGNIILVSDESKPIMAFRVLKTESDTGELIAKRVRRYDTTGELKINQPYTAAEKIADLVAPPPPEPGQYDPNAQPELFPNAKKADTTPPADSAAPPLMGASTASPGTDEAPAPNADTALDSPGVSAPSSPKAIEGMDVEKFDTDLDSSTSPKNINSHRNKKGVSTDEEIPSELMESKNGLEVEERIILQPFLNALTVQVGSFKNMSGFSTSSTSNTGFGIAFSHLFNRNIFFEHSSVQDSLSFEGGIANYSRTDFTGNNDDYTLLPVRAELRYDVYLSDAFTLFGYLGLQYNFLIGSDNVNTATTPVEQDALNALVGPQQTIGIGVFYNIGPQWYVRADLGWDRLAIGLTVKW